VIPEWGTTPLDRIHFEDIAEWLADLLSGEATGGRKLSPLSVRKAYVVLSRVLGILLLAYTGLRWGEASVLRVGRVVLDACRADIVEAYAEDNGKLYLDTPKNHERRSVPIPRFLADELKPHVQGRRDDDLLFTVIQHLFPDRLDEVSEKMHKRRSKQLAKAKAKLEKAEKRARRAAEAVGVLEDPAA
jgi:integrase